ncbi:TetR/AcrR family transcriptional regulator [Mesorhizobium sp. 113-3-9]|uniref:TetR/AcrR family transcriptional regulator n=1 Tax=Mesorhizobium sp. 113-3-9 TaxID=2744517 RepID=UPI001925AA18|nr:TetR/AcrR family transcriptional regulator [Mesorhizobium sp. 113-3-9]
MMPMAKTTQRTERRTDALSKERIIAAAIGILDDGGEEALTFRALSARLATGAGAIYWHVADKNELLAAATDDVITGAMTGVASGEEPRQAIRTIALGLFDVIEAHPWSGAQLSRVPWQACVGEIFESIGSQVDALGVAEQAQLDVASALVHYILGYAGQNAANAKNAQLLPPDTDRTAFLATIVVRWTQRDPAGFPFLQRMATQFAEHDDRQQFLAGIDLILAGIGLSDRN